MGTELLVNRGRTWFALVMAVFGLLLISGDANAQATGTISGTAINGITMEPLNGVQVVVENTGLGTLTDGRGRFLIPGVPAGTHTVRVTNIGFGTAEQTVTVVAGETASAEFELQISAVSLDEVVVTGTAGEIERKRLGTTVGSVNVSDLQDKIPVASVGDALAARIPGVSSVTTSGGVGAASDLRIRGTSSFQLGQRPVVYVDGVRIDNTAGEWASGGTCCSFAGGAGESRLSDINPSDIERIEVLKGAAAATLYGSEASNGVIQIFTKRGRNSSAPRFTVSAATGFNRYRENWTTKLYPNFTGPEGFQAHDANELIENGWIQNYNMTVQGGGQDVTYFISGGYDTEDGSLQPNSQTGVNLRTNLQWLASDDWSFNLNSAFAKNDVLQLQSGNNWTALYGNAILGNPLRATPERPFGEPWTPVEDIRAIETFSHATRWTGGFTATYRPSDSFSNRLTVGYDNVTDQKERLMPFGHEYVYLGSVGERNIGYRRGITATFDYLGNLGFDLTSGIASDFSFGAQGYWVTEELSMAIGQGFAAAGVTTVSGAAITDANESFEESITLGIFAQNRFSFSDRLFATLGIRLDGNSAFGQNYGLQPYPKADVAYLISEEGFVPEAISSLKLRAAIGTSGLAPGAYDQFQTFSPTAVLETDEPGVTPSNPGNPDLQPEHTTEIEAGFDMGLFDDRVGVEFTAYRAVTTDALLEIELPPSLGFSDEQLRNTGEILNVGWELSVNSTPVVTRDFRWNTQLNLFGNNNEVISLGETAVNGRLGGYREGFPVNAIWGDKVIGYDAATTSHSVTDTAVYFGPALPDFSASFANTLSFGAFRLYGLIAAERGAWFNNGDRPYRIRQGASDEYLRTLENGAPTVQTDSLVDYFSRVGSIDQRDNIRIREVSLSYTLPTGLVDNIGLGNTSLTLSGQNLYWWDDCNCSDPNMRYTLGSFSGFLAMPASRRFLLSLRTSF